MLKIELPWPDPCLSPNRTKHWGKKSQATKKARSDAFYAFSGVTLPEWVKNLKNYANASARARIPMRVVFHQPTNHKRDWLNCARMIKAYEDGICDVLGIDDWHICPVTIDFGENVKGGSVVITILPPQEQLVEEF